MPVAKMEALTEITPELLRALTEIEQNAFGRGGMNEWFLPPFVRQGRVFVLWVADVVEPVGVAECMRIWERPQAVYLFGFAIRRDWRGQGLGTLFMQKICRWLLRGGFSSLELTVSPQNKAALRIYRGKLGFATVRFYPGEYGPAEDRLLLRLDLRSLPMG